MIRVDGPMKYVGYTFRFGRGCKLCVLSTRINSTSVVIGNPGNIESTSYMFLYFLADRGNVSASTLRKFNCIGFYETGDRVTRVLLFDHVKF